MEVFVGSALVAGGFAIGAAADEIARRLLRFRDDCNEEKAERFGQRPSVW